MYIHRSSEPWVRDAWCGRSGRWLFGLARGRNLWSLGWHYRGPVPSVRRYELWLMLGPFTLCVYLMDARPGDRIIQAWLEGLHADKEST